MAINLLDITVIAGNMPAPDYTVDLAWAAWGNATDGPTGMQRHS